MKIKLTLLTLFLVVNYSLLAQDSESKTTPDAAKPPVSGQTPDMISVPGPDEKPEPAQVIKLPEDSDPMDPTEKAFMQSAYEGRLASVEKLLKKGASVDATDKEGRTAMMMAAYNGHTAVVEFLLKNGANINSKDKGGSTALMYTSKRSFDETSNYLLENGIDVNAQTKKRGVTALMIVAVAGNVEMVRTLLLKGADPDLKDRFGYTAESLAQRKGNSAVVEQLKNPPEPKAGT